MECYFAEAAEHVIKKVRGRFLSHNIMDALGLVYPKYWLNGNPQALFRGHLDLIKKITRNLSGFKREHLRNYAYSMYLML